MKIVFFGSDDFANVHLEALISSDNEVIGCVTQPDRPKNRGMKVIMSPIKETALKHNIPVFQPNDLNDVGFYSSLQDVCADLFVVIAYGKFLPQELIDMPSYGAINVHGSLLPKYRGAAPINWAIINGDKQTGVTIIQLNVKMDAGDILSSETIDILDDDTSAVLRERMKERGQELLINTINDMQNGKIQGRVQDQSQASFAKKLTKELGKIDWNKSAVEIDALVRGLQPWPSAYTFLNGKFLKILSAQVVDTEGEAGQVVDIQSDGFVIATQKGGLLVKKVHLENSKSMDSASFLRGHKIDIGFNFA